MRVVISLKKIVKIITCLLAFLIVGTTLAGCTNVRKRANDQDNWKKIEKKKKVVIGLDDSFVPMGFREKDGSLVGVDPKTAENDACRMEHVISAESFEKIKAAAKPATKIEK